MVPKAQPKAPTDNEPPPDGTEYDAFEDLTRKLLAVSKKDLDEARAREDAEKG